MAKALQVKIPNPCHEKWSEMTPNQQGAFCNACQKTVIDFTTKTENEIYDILVQSKSNTCGRFTSFQLQHPVRKTELKNGFFNWKAIAASFTALTATHKLSAKADLAPFTIVTDTAGGLDVSPINAEVAIDSTLIIEGRVTSANDGSSVYDAIVSIPGTQYKTHADKNGYYKLEIPCAEADSLPKQIQFYNSLFETKQLEMERWESKLLNVKMNQFILLMGDWSGMISVTMGATFIPEEPSIDSSNPWVQTTFKSVWQYYLFPTKLTGNDKVLPSANSNAKEPEKKKPPAMQKLIAWISERKKQMLALTKRGKSDNDGPHCVF